jgi:hypothetical protein
LFISSSGRRRVESLQTHLQTEIHCAIISLAEHDSLLFLCRGLFGKGLPDTSALHFFVCFAPDPATTLEAILSSLSFRHRRFPLSPSHCSVLVFSLHSTPCRSLVSHRPSFFVVIRCSSYVLPATPPDVTKLEDRVIFINMKVVVGKQSETVVRQNIASRFACFGRNPQPVFESCGRSALTSLLVFSDALVRLIVCFQTLLSFFLHLPAPTADAVKEIEAAHEKRSRHKDTDNLSIRR